MDLLLLVREDLYFTISHNATDKRDGIKMKLPFLLFLTLMSSSLAVLGQDGKWSDLPSCAVRSHDL